MVIVAVVVDTFPQSSVAVKVIVLVVPQAGIIIGELVILTLLSHKSEARADATHEEIIALLLVDPHSKVMFAGGVIIGATLSVIVYVLVTSLLLFPHSSSTQKLTLYTPVLGQEPGANEIGLKLLNQLNVPQTSTTLALVSPPLLDSHAERPAPFPFP